MTTSLTLLGLMTQQDPWPCCSTAVVHALHSSDVRPCCELALTQSTEERARVVESCKAWYVFEYILRWLVVRALQSLGSNPPFCDKKGLIVLKAFTVIVGTASAFAIYAAAGVLLQASVMAAVLCVVIVVGLEIVYALVNDCGYYIGSLTLAPLIADDEDAYALELRDCARCVHWQCSGCIST